MMIKLSYSRIITYVVCVMLFMTATEICSAQSGMTFDEFSLKLSAYFDVELIDDIKKQ